MKIKNVYVATRPVYLTDARGNTKELPVGHEVNEKQFLTLTKNQQAKFTAKTVQVGRARFAAGTWAELPLDAAGARKRSYARHEFHLLPPAVRELIEEIDPLWLAETGFALPGVGIHEYRGDDHLTWWIEGTLLPANLPPMYATTGRPCAALPKRNPSPYRYHTAALLKVAERLRGGRPVFAYAEGIDRLVAEVLAA
jgi:hypothetical protein